RIVSDRNFMEILQKGMDAGKVACVGLDSDVDKLPADQLLSGKYRTPLRAIDVFRFNKVIVDATKDIALAFKPNSAFYEQLGEDGFRTLRQTISYIHEVAPDAVVIFDGKRGDIGSTNDGYVRAVFGQAQEAEASAERATFAIDSLGAD